MCNLSMPFCIFAYYAFYRIIVYCEIKFVNGSFFSFYYYYLRCLFKELYIYIVDKF